MYNLVSRITRVKPESVIFDEIAEEQKEGNGLRKTQTFFTITLFGAANVIGVGIFVTAGTAAGKIAGPGVIMSYILGGLTCALTGVCYARFSSRLASSGSSYTYVYSSLGEIFAFFAGLGLCSETSIASAALARSWAAQLRLVSQAQWIPDPFPIIKDFVVVDILAPVLCVLITIACLSGMRESARFGTTMTLFNCGMILIFIFTAFLTRFDAENFTPALPWGVQGVMKATSLTLFSYVGWDSVCCLSEEVKNPQRVIPMAIGANLLLVGSLYCLMAAALIGMAPISFLENTPDLADVFDYRGASWAAQFVRYGILLTTATASLASAQGQPRIWFRMARDGLLPASLCQLDSRGTPMFAIGATGVITILVSLLIDVNKIFDIIVVGVLLMQAFVCIGCLIWETEQSGGSREAMIWKSLALSICSVMLGGSFQETQTDNAGDTWLVVSYVFLAGSIASALAVLHSLGGQRWSRGVIPAIATALNFFYTGSLSFIYMGVLLGAYAFISLIYFLYGIRHSRLGRDGQAARNEQVRLD